MSKQRRLVLAGALIVIIAYVEHMGEFPTEWVGYLKEIQKIISGEEVE